MRGAWCASPVLDLRSFCAGTAACFGLFFVEVYFCTGWCRLNHGHFGFVHVGFFFVGESGCIGISHEADASPVCAERLCRGSVYESINKTYFFGGEQ
jgi:hypothetical protein